ncbi:cytochrome P450 71A1-like [Momordica charantia]|uniref:Cytochrome P450 71A1-like n=1 Tax=Momordica charantia TaxID=3673 RepID=A0A6J1C6A2_MOMCH|nr:cytochrome P450 71A1-like [Momordica charantia]
MGNPLPLPLPLAMAESFTFWFSLSIFLFILILILKPKPGTKTKFNLPPSPPRLPIIGNLHQLGHLPHLSLRRLSHKFGPIILLRLGQIPTVVISSAKLAKATLKTHDLALCNRPFLISAKHIFYNCTDIAFSPYGSYWRQIRKIAILELLSAKRVQSYASIRQQEVARLVHRVAQSPYPDAVDLSKILLLYANDVLCRVALGRDFSGGGEYHLHGFQELLEEFQVLVGGFILGDLFPSFAFVNTLTGMKSRLVRTFKGFDRIFDQVIEEHLSPERRSLGEAKDLVDVLLDIQENGSDDKIQLTMDNVKAIILDMFVGGTDTTFIILDWGMTELITNPKAMERAQKEVRSIVGDRRLVSESDLSRMPYLKAVVKEIHRLHPPVPVLVPRESMEDITIESYDIPAKTRFFVNAWAIGRDPESWEEPEKFDPERFIDTDVDFSGQDFEFIPFGAGRRICPGITMAIATIELALAQLLHSFDWELPNGIEAKDLDMSEVFGITMHRIQHLEVLAKPYFAS